MTGMPASEPRLLSVDQPDQAERDRRETRPGSPPGRCRSARRARRRGRSRAIGMSVAIELMTNRFIPTGGVISPTSTTISTRMPNQSAKSSGARPKSSADHDREEDRHGQQDHGQRVHDAAEDQVEAAARPPAPARARSPGSATHRPTSCGSCDRARKPLKTPAPRTMRKIIAVDVAVARIASRQCRAVQTAAETSAIRPVPAAPTAAASVGVNKPA